MDILAKQVGIMRTCMRIASSLRGHAPRAERKIGSSELHAGIVVLLVQPIPQTNPQGLRLPTLLATTTSSEF